MFTKSIGDRWRNANRRRTEAAVRVDRAVQELAQPPRHRAPVRGARAAMTQIEAEAPVQPRMRPRDGLAIPAVALQDLVGYRERLLGWAADDETMARDLKMRAAQYRAIADGYEKLLALPQALAFGHLVDDDRQGRGPRCFGCGRPGDTVPCWNQLEGREVPLCPACHPSADEIDDTGADGEEPEHIASASADLPEDLVSSPLGPWTAAAVPQLQLRDGVPTEQVFPWWEARPAASDVAYSTAELAMLDGAER